MIAVNYKNKTQRVTWMFRELQEGKVLKKPELATQFNVSLKTIQRDIDELRSIFSEDYSPYHLVYYKAKGGYMLDAAEGDVLTDQEILATVKILLESRALLKTEVTTITKKIYRHLPKERQRMIDAYVSNEMHYYKELTHQTSVLTKVHELAEASRAKQSVMLMYKKEHEPEAKAYHIEPLGVVFSEYYFYVIAESTTKERPHPVAYRIDRIEHLHIRQRFERAEVSRFEESKFQQRIHFMHTGEEATIRLRFSGKSPQAVLDRLPTGKIVKYEENAVIIEAEVYLRGIEMWLLSQGEHIEVLSPPSLRQRMKERAQKLTELYE